MNVSHHYRIAYPAHPARESDPHYKDFDAYHRRTRATARCAMGVRRGTFDECRDAKGEPCVIGSDGVMSGLELHHAHVEFALLNAVDLAVLERDYPGVSNPDEVGAWVESAANLEWLCAGCHRGVGGVHNASAADYEASAYVRGLIS